ncbi:MAG: sigma factor-like helix-turn-helix DNA-binding protein [bacterium]|nr:sigma factor-like helix-turn-helix DNA-binding protein [bacterium]
MKINYQKVCSELIRDLPQRTADVIERRFGLNSAGERETLEHIGQSYNITRERVRQIENEGFNHIIPKLENYQEVFKGFDGAIESFGGLKKEEELLGYLGEGKENNCVLFLLTISKGLKRFQEDENYHSFWIKDEAIAEKAKKTVNFAIKGLEKQKRPVTLDELAKISEKEKENSFLSVIEISKKIKRNPEGFYGLANWVEINPKGIKDKAFLVFKKEGKPLHFTEVAKQIEKLPVNGNKKVHTATVHNELIKDARFVLVGRGLYALTEWGYEPGVVRDVITKIIQGSKKPLTRDEITEKVMAQRFVKENTILLNLQDKSCFVRDEKGRYNVKEA